MQPHPFPGDPPVFTCPLGYFRDHPEMEGMGFSLHLHWTHGILPEAGGLEDQAAGFASTMTAMENGVQAGRQRLQEVEQRKAERNNKSTTASNTGRSRRR